MPNPSGGDPILGHSGVPLAAAFTGVLLMGASLCYRLPGRARVLSSIFGLGAALLPSVAPHYAKDRWDLFGLMLLAVFAFAANVHASRSRVAQLPLTWRTRVDAELRLLADEPRG